MIYLFAYCITIFYAISSDSAVCVSVHLAVEVGDDGILRASQGMTRKGKDEPQSVDVLAEMAATYRAQRELAEVQTKYYKMKIELLNAQLQK